MDGTVMVRFEHGPAHGRYERVRVGDGGRPEAVRVFTPVPLYVGSSDEPAPAEPVTYRLTAEDPGDPLCDYVYVHSTT